MKVYSPGDISNLLKVKESTLRKYSILLEKSGYDFQKNSRKQRYYSDNDIITLRKLITLKNNGMTLEESVEGVILWHKGNEEEETSITPYQTDTNSVTTPHNSDITELKELVHKQNDLIKELSNRLDQQQQYLDTRLKERDQAIMQRMDESLEAQKQIAATTKEKKSIWGKLFKKE